MIVLPYLSDHDPARSRRDLRAIIEMLIRLATVRPAPSTAGGERQSPGRMDRVLVELVSPPFYDLLMDGKTPIDTSFDMRTDARGHDPDSHSATLRRYHQLLWSKTLPTGETFELDAKLHHNSDLGEFWLASDSIVHTYTRWARPTRLVRVIHELPPEETTAFYDLACTVGAYLVFPPQVRVDGHWRPSINQRRGIHHQIRDRFDLTLECIRRHYICATSPLSEVFAPYANFFGLFGDFSGYVDYFLLNDLVADGATAVRFFKEFDDFAGDPLPAGSVAEYRQYMKRSMNFIHARNGRIARYATAMLRGTI